MVWWFFVKSIVYNDWMTWSRACDVAMWMISQDWNNFPCWLICHAVEKYWNGLAQHQLSSPKQQNLWWTSGRWTAEAIWDQKDNSLSGRGQGQDEKSISFLLLCIKVKVCKIFQKFSVLEILPPCFISGDYFTCVTRHNTDCNLKRRKCETLYGDFVTAAATYFCVETPRGTSAQFNGGEWEIKRLTLGPTFSFAFTKVENKL